MCFEKKSFRSIIIAFLSGTMPGKFIWFALFCGLVKILFAFGWLKKRKKCIIAIQWQRYFWCVWPCGVSHVSAWMAFRQQTAPQPTEDIHRTKIFINLVSQQNFETKPGYFKVKRSAPFKWCSFLRASMGGGRIIRFFHWKLFGTENNILAIGKFLKFLFFLLDWNWKTK